MMRHCSLLTLAATFLAAGCTPERSTPTFTEVRLPLRASSARNDNTSVHLNGDGEVPPRETQAQGQAILRIADDGSSFDFKLIASNIDNVIMAHIHCGPAGVNGPIRVWFYPVIGLSGAPAPSGAGRHDGVLAEGSFTFPAAGLSCPAVAAGPNNPAVPAMSLLDAIHAGYAYVNVHTNDGVGATNTGAGDFPGGEIRAQTAK
jgi:hypothetical protein